MFGIAYFLGIEKMKFVLYIIALFVFIEKSIEAKRESERLYAYAERAGTLEMDSLIAKRYANMLVVGCVMFLVAIFLEIVKSYVGISIVCAEIMIHLCFLLWVNTNHRHMLHVICNTEAHQMNMVV